MPYGFTSIPYNKAQPLKKTVMNQTKKTAIRGFLQTIPNAGVPNNYPKFGAGLGASQS